MADEARGPTTSTAAVRVPPWLVFGLLAAAALVLVPYWAWIVVAVWIADLGRRLIPPLTRLTGRRRRAAAVLTVALLSVVVVPALLLATSLVVDAIALGERLAASAQVRAVLESLVTDAGAGAAPAAATPATAAQSPLDLLVAHGAQAWTVLALLASAATHAVIGLVVFIASAYVVLADGPDAYAWLERHAPVPREVFRRLAAAFLETGHGLVIGVFGAGLVQAALATIFYVAIDVPQPFVLGLLTLLASVVPAIGTSFVWLPVAAGLALTGRTDAAIAMGAFGLLVIGTVDNLVRPWLARWAHLALPAPVIMIAMFGGISLVGPSGLILGPLALRLAKEALVIAREQREP